MIYLLLFSIGGIGFLATFLLGFAHIGGHGHAHVGGHHVGGAHGVHHASLGHVAKAQFSAKGFANSAKGWLAISPLDIFGLCLGAGAAGLLLRPYLSASLLPWAAAVGAIVLTFLVLKPLGSLVERFASHPSEGLEGTIAKPAMAVTGFDSSGRGLVRVNVDGQIVQMLATLDSSEIGIGTPVRKGDEVIVVEVDSKRNSCRVSKDLS